MPLNAGILIIGSLLWDEGHGRPAWRKARLDGAGAQAVTAPIRYGRLSGKNRGHTYTMVFSRLADPGHATVVECAQKVSMIGELIGEAEALWKAEQPSASPGRIAADWGCVAILCNPERIVPAEILNGWARRVADEPDYGNVHQTEAEGKLVSDEGLLQIAWPHLVDGGGALELDILLVTANDPTLSGMPPEYPSVETIARAWNAAGDHVEYFWRNRDCGIRTFQDDELLDLLNPRGRALV